MEGALFLNGFVPAPSCTPCRSSILSGRYFWQTGLGAILQGAVWDETIPSYPLILEQAGYHIGYTYKVWSPGRNVNAPYGGDRARYEGAGSLFNRFSHVVKENASDLGVDGAKQMLLDEVRRNFDSFLEARPEGAPFCYWWGPTNTHRTWERGSGKALWGYRPRRPEGTAPRVSSRRARRARGRGRLSRGVHGGGRGTGGPAGASGSHWRARQHSRRGERRSRHPRVPTRQMQSVRHRLRSGSSRPLAGTHKTGARRRGFRKPDGPGADLP